MTAELITQQDSVAIYEVIGSGDEARINAMLNLYGDLFPQYKHYLPRMRNRAKFPSRNERGHIVHYWLIEVDSQPAGMRTFRYIPLRRCGIAIALAVHPDFRKVRVGGQGLAAFIISQCLAQVIADAKAAGDPPVLGMVNEVEYPRLMEKYKQYGLIELPVKYVEPIFSAPARNISQQEELEQIEFSPMFIGFLPNPELEPQDYDQKKISDFALAFLTDHYGLPIDHPEVQSVIQSIPKVI